MVCDICTKNISNANFTKHRIYCEHIRDNPPKPTIQYKEWFNGEVFICPDCEFKGETQRVIVSHYYKKHIFKHKPSNTPKPKRTSWLKGLTKETDERVARMAATLSKTQKGKPGRPQTEKHKKDTSIRMSLKNPGGKCKWFCVAGQKVQGTYEKQLAEAFEEQNILWEKIHTNTHIFSYIFDNKQKSYAPDFYLPEYDLYIEIKGFWWGNDKEKMNAVRKQHLDKKLILLYGKSRLDEFSKDIRKNLVLEPVWSWQ